MDITCAWCGEPWNVSGLRHNGWAYVTGSGQATQLKVLHAYALAYIGEVKPQRYVSQRVYETVLRGKGCTSCGFSHGDGVGPYREEQLRELVIDGVTDDPTIWS